MVEFAGGLDFQGAKLTDMKEVDKMWYRAIRKVHYRLKDFIVANFPTICKWQGENEDALSFYEGSVEGAKCLLGDQAVAATTQPAPVPVKKEVPSGGATAAPAKKPAKVVKQPTMVKKGMIWEFADYNKETLKLEAHQIDSKMSYNFFNCERCNIVIPGKIKTVLMSRCKGTKLQVDEVIS
jgi:hypothetical protein